MELTNTASMGALLARGAYTLPAATASRSSASMRVRHNANFPCRCTGKKGRARLAALTRLPVNNLDKRFRQADVQAHGTLADTGNIHIDDHPETALVVGMVQPLIGQAGSGQRVVIKAVMRTNRLLRSFGQALQGIGRGKAPGKIGEYPAPGAIGFVLDVQGIKHGDNSLNQTSLFADAAYRCRGKVFFGVGNRHLAGLGSVFEMVMRPNNADFKPVVGLEFLDDCPAIHLCNYTQQTMLVNDDTPCYSTLAAQNNGSAGLTARQLRRKKTVPSRLGHRGFLLRSMARSLWTGYVGGGNPCRFLSSGLSTCIVPSTSFDSGERVNPKLRSYAMTHVTTPALSVGSVTIRAHDGLYSLNDLHQASGGEAKHQPALFVRLDTTQALIAEIHSTDSQSAAINTVNGGRYRGTYACRELVIAYAAWISAEFHLKVIRVFLDTAMAQPALPQSEPHKALSPAVAQEIAAQASQSILDALARQNMLVDWAQVTDALTDRNSTITLHELTDLIHACLIRLQRNVNSEAYQCIARRAANQGVSTSQVSLNA